MSRLKVKGGEKFAKLVITIIGKIEIDDLDDISDVEECLEKIREYGTAEITHTEIVEVNKNGNE